MTRLRIAVIAVAAVALIGAGCSAEPSEPRPPRKANRAEKAKVAQEAPPEDRAVAVAEGKGSGQRPEAYIKIGTKDDAPAVVAEVKQGKAKAPAAKPTRTPKPDEPLPAEEPTFTVAGDFLPTKEKAKESAIREAVEKLHQYLLEQSPQVTKYPTTEMVRRMLVRHPEARPEEVEFGKVTTEQLSISEGGQPETLYKVEIAVRVKPEQVRELRSRERSSETLWMLAGLGGLAAVVAVFFRIDAWTKGYLTSWLVLGTVGAAALLGGLWWFAR